MTIFTTITDIRNWVDTATSNWADRTDDQVNRIVGVIRDNTDYGRGADDYLETLPDNLADLLDDTIALSVQS
jgi:hypothetical protein